MQVSRFKDSIAVLFFIIGFLYIKNYNINTIKTFLFLAGLFDLIFVLNPEYFKNNIGNNKPTWFVILFFILMGYIAATRMENRI